MANTEGKRRKVRVSKNKKKSWIKYSDIKEIDDYLEEQRFEERTGGRLHDVPNEKLFFIEQEIKVLPKEYSKNKKIKPLRCFRNLTAYSKVPAPVPVNKGIIGKKQQKRMTRVLQRRLLNIEPVKKPTVLKKKELSSRPFYKLWSEDTKVKTAEEIIGKKQPKVPSHRFTKPSLLPAVEIPHPGASYNPSYDDHQELLLEAVLVEQKKEKEEQHLKRVLTDMFPKGEEAPTHETWLQEMSTGLFEHPDNKDAENEDDGHFEMANPAVRAEDRKTKAQKNKRKRIKEVERQKKLVKLEKQRVHAVYRLRSLKKEIVEKEKISKEKQDKKDQRQMEKMYEPHTLSQYKYEPQDLEVKLTEELKGSLRELKAEGSLLEDRFKSLQKRNIIEPRVKQRMKRKYKLKVQVKRSHRDFE